MKQSGEKDSRKGSIFARRRMRWTVLLILALALSLVPSGVSFAVAGVVMDGRVEDVPGVRFENMLYAWDSLAIDVVNMTNQNMMFGGTLTFFDRRGRPVASARLLPKKIIHDSVERYRGYFVEGTGETARRASRILWEFGPR